MKVANAIQFTSELQQKLDGVYVHVDMDVHDPNLAPVNSYQPSDGLSPEEVVMSAVDVLEAKVKELREDEEGNRDQIETLAKEISEKQGPIAALKAEYEGRYKSSCSIVCTSFFGYTVLGDYYDTTMATWTTGFN